jgi:hypothetical protein
MDGGFFEGMQVCEGFGSVKTYVLLMGEELQCSRDSRYAMPSAAPTSRAMGCIIWDLVEQPQALLAQM